MIYKRFKKGFYTGILIYAIGFLISLLYYFYVPQESYMPATYMLILIGLFYVSVLILFVNMILLLVKKLRPLCIGMMIVNALYLLISLIYLYFRPI